MVDLPGLGVTFAAAPFVQWAIAWKWAPLLRRRRSTLFHVLGWMVVLTAAAMTFGVTFASHYLNLAWALILVVGLWCIPTALSDPIAIGLQYSPWTLKVVAASCAIAVGSLLMTFGGMQIRFGGEGLVNYPLVHRTWIDGGALSRKNVWVVEIHRCVRWMPLVATRVASLEVEYRDSDISKLRVDVQRDGGSEVVVAEVEGVGRAEVRLP